jgi:hypothetical protein
MQMPRFSACDSIMAWLSRTTSVRDVGSSDSGQLPGLDQREVEDFVDQFQQVPPRLEDLVDAAFLGGGR